MLYPSSGSFQDAWVPGTSLVVQGLRLCASSARGVGLISDQATKTPHSTACAQNSLKMKNKNKKQLLSSSNIPKNKSYSALP